MQYGTVRKIDKPGRIVIPKEMRDFFKMKEKEEVELKATNKGVLITIPDIEIKRKNSKW